MHTEEPARFPLTDADEHGHGGGEHRPSNWAVSWTTVFHCLRNGNGSQRDRARIHRDGDDGGGDGDDLSRDRLMICVDQRRCCWGYCHIRGTVVVWRVRDAVSFFWSLGVSLSSVLLVLRLCPGGPDRLGRFWRSGRWVLWGPFSLSKDENWL